jgi:16S rRNA (guanine(966)-N(2))-methyltransferase RsmD
MRIIGGKYRGRRLRAVSGLEVRPTSDRLRETLFNILAPRISGTRFLDLCAGSGAVGIEALSRGAHSVTFIDRSPRSCSTIRQNLAGLLDSGETDAVVRVRRADASAAIRELIEEGDRFDVVFFDPPYESGLYERVMVQLGTGRILSPSGIVVVEHRLKTQPETEYGCLTVYRRVKQGESGLLFYENASRRSRTSARSKHLAEHD